MGARRGHARSYSVQDNGNNGQFSRNFTYVFNICANTLTVPKQQQCGTTYDDPVWQKKNPKTGVAPAFQYWNDWTALGSCYRLGSMDVPPVWGLFDVSSPVPNPSLGISIAYQGGDKCPASIGRSRSLKLWVECYDDAFNIPDTEAVMESNACQYDIYFKSAFGCPTECPVTNYQLWCVCAHVRARARARPTPGLTRASRSGGHGVCDFDATNAAPRCFCYSGYSGAGCDPTVAPTPASNAAAGVLIAVCIFLALTMGLLGFLWFRIRSLRLDPDAYKFLSLSGGDADAGKAETDGAA